MVQNGIDRSHWQLPQKGQEFMGMGTKIFSSQRVKPSCHNVDKSMWWHNVEKFDPVSTVLFLLSHKLEDTSDYHTPLGEQEVLPWLPH